MQVTGAMQGDWALRRSESTDRVVVIGAGLAGGLLALELADLGLPVTVVDGAGPGATPLSYGGIPWWAGPPGQLDSWMAAAPSHWRRLEARHGPLGLSSCALVLHWPAAADAAARQRQQGVLQQVEGLARRHLGADQLQHGPPLVGAAGPAAAAASGAGGTLRLSYARVDPGLLAAALPGALRAAGVRLLRQQVAAIEPTRSGWHLRLAAGTGGGGDTLPFRQVVLAAGAGCRALWPLLPQRLRVSWAGALLVDRLPLALPFGDAIVMPLLGQRQGLEARSAQLAAPELIVDVGWAPSGSGWLLGQTSLVRADPGQGPPPDPHHTEACLRQALAGLLPQLAELPGRFVQVPVSFTHPGLPLVGAVPGAPGLWVFAGFGGPFALVPALVPLLAAAIAGDPAALVALPGAAPGVGGG
jgi:glycine/D-amino acid oxidase-like deaminating enzyme